MTRPLPTLAAVTLGAIIGLSASPGRADTLDDINRQTNAALHYAAKEWWRNCTMAAEMNKAELHKRGVAFQAYIVRLPDGSHHEVVGVQTAKGERVLNNLTDDAGKRSDLTEFRGYTEWTEVAP